jgi:hypothetical protein
MTALWAKRTIWAGAVKSTGPRENKKEKKELESWAGEGNGPNRLGLARKIANTFEILLLLIWIWNQSFNSSKNIFSNSNKFKPSLKIEIWDLWTEMILKFNSKF